MRSIFSGPGDGLYERFWILATKAGAGSQSAAEREQLGRLLRSSGVETEASFLPELERAAISSDESSIRGVLQKRSQLKPEQLDGIVEHTLILYRDSRSTAADRAIIHDNIMEVSRFAWSLLSVLLVSLLLSIWAGARGVRVARTNVRT